MGDGCLLLRQDIYKYTHEYKYIYVVFCLACNDRTRRDDFKQKNRFSLDIREKKFYCEDGEE